MADPIAQLALQIQQLQSKGILYLGDPKLPKHLSSIIADYAASGVPDAMLRAVVDSHLQSFRRVALTRKSEYVNALAILQAQVLKNPLRDQYLKMPSQQTLNTLVQQYIEIAPSHTILECARLPTFEKLLLEGEFSTLDSVGKEEFDAAYKALRDIDRNMTDVQEGVLQLTKILNNITRLPTRVILCIAFTPEGLSLPFDGMHALPYDKTLTGLLFTGLIAHHPFDIASLGYAAWYLQLMAYVSTIKHIGWRVFQAVFPLPGHHVMNSVVPDSMTDVVHLAGEAFAALCTVVSSEALQQVILPRLAHMYIHGLSVEQQPFDQPFKDWAWAILPKVSKSVQGVLESVALWVNKANIMADQLSSPVNLLNPVIGFFYTFCISAYEFIDKMIDLFVYGLNKIGGPLYKWLIEYLYLGRAWASVVLPGARRRVKSVWALMALLDFTRLDPGTRFALSCNVMKQGPNPDYTEWEANLQKAINATGLGDWELFPQKPLRPLRLPSNPWTIKEEVLAMAPLFPGQTKEVHFMDEKLSVWSKYSVPQGIDGQWFATPDRVAQSIRRYDVDRTEPDDYTTGLMRETAHALADKYPEMYKYHQYFTPQHAMRRLKWDTNMSPGLGFIGNVRTRKQLRQHGFLAAILEVATKRLQEGVNEGTVAHAFVKEDVVALDKLLKGKNIRTVVAMDLMSNTLALPFSIELSRAPPPEAFVLNALPRSDGGYRPMFDAMKKHVLVLQADASEFDSKLGPVITVEGLSELRSIGFESNPAFPVISSQIKAHYMAMRHACIADLTTGTIFRKTGGMMTGQVNTSYDNRDAFRLMIVGGWSHVTGRPAAEFWDTNTLANAGDDDVIGTDEPRELWIKIFAEIKDLFGVTVNLEEEGWHNLSITALQPVPEGEAEAHYRSIIGMPTVTYGIRSEPAKLLLKKTEFKARVARLTDIPFRQAHIDSMIGTAYLSAYNPEIYNDLSELYEQDMRYVLLRFYSSVQVTKEYDKFGHLTSLVVIPGHIRPRYAAKEGDINRMINDWLKKVKWPGYQKIFNIWVRPYDENRSSIAKHYRTLVSGGPALPVAYKLLYGLVGFREALYTIPNHVVRALPEFPGADISMTLKTPQFIVERFIWLSLFHKQKRVPTKSGFLTAMREGPYASACSPMDFLEFIEQEHYMSNLVKQDLEVLRAQAMLVTLIYTFLERMLNVAAQTPFLGLFVNLYALATRDVNRIYATTNHVYWLAEGRSSAVISNLMPADPYAWMKQVAVIAASGIPAKWVLLPGLKHAVAWAPALVEAWTLAAVTVSPNVGRLTFKGPPQESPWAHVITSILNIMLDTPIFSANVVAPTGSGKSTLFVALLNQVIPGRRIWLLHPTKAARDEYVNDFLPEGFCQAYMRGVTLRADSVVVSVTYGFYIQVRNMVNDSDIVIFDEIHLSPTESWTAWFLSDSLIRITMTATPKYEMQPTTEHYLTYPGTRRFKMKMTYVPGTFEQLFTMITRERPELLSRALIICPTLHKVHFVRNTLSRLSYSSSEYSSDNPVVAPSGIIVATSIADQALTINPPPSVVIDLGEMLQVTVKSCLGELIPVHEVKLLPVSQEVADQRAGRGGRASDSEGYGLIVGPRTPHSPPQRHPMAVLMSDTASDSVMVALQLRNPLTPLNAWEGMIKFVQLAEGFGGFDNPHVLKLALMMLCYFSAGSSYETFCNDHFNCKYASDMADQYRVVASLTEQIWPDANHLEASCEVAHSLLERGVFECDIQGRKWPTAAFIFQDGWLMPVGADLNQFLGNLGGNFLPSMSKPRILRGFKDHDWTQLLAMMVPSGAINISETLVADPLTLVGDLVYNDQHPPFRYVPWAMYTHDLVQDLLLYSPNNTAIVILVWNAQQAVPKHLNLMPNFAPFTQPVRYVTQIPLALLGITLRSALPLAVVIASALKETQVMFIGAIPQGVISNHYIVANRMMIWGHPDDPYCVGVPSTIARAMFVEASYAAITGNSKSMLSCAHIAIMSGVADLAAWVAFQPQARAGYIQSNRLIVI